MRAASAVVLVLLLALVGCAAKEPPRVESPPEPQPIPPALTSYMGREIAQTMHWMGAEWLLRETREDEEHASRLFELLAVRPGMAVCDLGCGNGFHTLRLAEAVGDDGMVYAVDIQPEMLEFLAERQREAGLENIERIHGSVADPRLPSASCDMVLMVDVYHEFGHPEQMLARLREALKPGGVVVLVEFRAEDPAVPIKPEHKMSKEQMHRELAANGFVPVREFDELPWQHVVFYGLSER